MHAQALAYLGDIAWKNNQPDNALHFFERATQVSHDVRIVYVDLGALYMQQKKYKDAQVALLRAVTLDPALPDAHYQLGQLYQTLGNTADAESELRKVRELHEKEEASGAGKTPSRLPEATRSDNK